MRNSYKSLVYLYTRYILPGEVKTKGRYGSYLQISKGCHMEEAEGQLSMIHD